MLIPRKISLLAGLSLCLAMVLAVGPDTTAGAAEKKASLIARKPVPAEMVAADAEKLIAQGAAYKPSGFSDFPNDHTPFTKWRRIATGRLEGKEVFVSEEGIRIWKTIFCGPRSVFLELSLMDRQGRKLPFAWIKCNFQCEYKGTCGLQSELFVDITGDGRPEIRFPDMETCIKVRKSFFRNPRHHFTVDIIPTWLARDLGPDYKYLSTVKPDASVGPWQDNPLSILGKHEEAR